MKQPSSAVKSGMFTSLAAVSGALAIASFVSDAVAAVITKALSAFIGLMLPDLSAQSVVFSLIPLATAGGLAAACAGCAYLAAGGHYPIGAVAAAALTAVSVFTLDVPTIAAAAAGGFGCLLCIAAYRRLTKACPAVFNRETVSYIVFGVLTTVVSFVSQMLFASLGTPAWVNTIGSWVCAVTFAYVVNKLFVFESRTDTKAAFFRELWLFFAARLASLGMELVFMFVTVDLLHFSEAVCKLIAQVFILVANYIFSKLIIFKKP